jgi:hypothetical protein
MKNIAILSLLLLLPTTAFSKNYESSFIEDMPKVTASEVDPDMLEWTKADINLLSYGSLAIAQPIIILSDKNKYKGIQPDQLKLLADRVEAMFTSQFGDMIDIVETPQSDSLVMNIAITELIMKKHRGVFGYTPGGALLHAATSNNKIEDVEKLAKKITMKDANLEVGFVDGGTGELIGVRILQITGKQDGRDEKSWPALRKEITALAERFSTNYKAALNNAGKLQ